MASLLGALSAVARQVFGLLEEVPAMISLAAVSVLAGIGMLWVFGRLSRQEDIRRVKRELAACLYEIRLFAEEPWLILRAQKRLLAGTARYVALMFLPAMILAVPMLLVLVHLDAFYGRSPLAVGEAALVTVQLDRTDGAQLVLEPPAGIEVETPPVHVRREGKVVWRIRPEEATAGNLRLRLAGRIYEKQIVSGQGPRYLVGRRVRSLSEWLLVPGERRLPEGPVEAIEIAYPPAHVGWGSFAFHWLVWFVVISLASAWAFRGVLGVAL